MNVRNQIENLSQIFPAQTTPAAAAAKSTNPSQSEGLGTDKAQLSDAATQVAQSAATSDIRLDKVASIQAALQAGIYDVPAADVAQKIIASMLEPGK
jgi:negative regulator of flagellin synthesis FlgM